MKRLLTLLWLTLAVCPVLQAAVSFNRDIRPILSDNCFYCHGNDASHRKAKLRLDRREDALEKNAFVPGNPEKSELIKRLHSSDADEVMPPPDSHKTLTAAQKEMLARWIREGAPYEPHWSYAPPRRAPVKPGENGVDFLVEKRLRTLGLTPVAEADPRTLIRRLYADLLGLPPTPEEVRRFVEDPSADAYAQLVERVLSNPHHGERMAAGWLDVVRFADTIGYHSDTPRNVWPYRDWVIESFNQNKRFDRFTEEQIAGDLLPDASTHTRVGSAFNRLLLTTEEGGAQAKDYEQRMLADRVRAVGAAWLGQTTGCAQCHDHKFDPFTMRDFYSLGAFFADIKEPLIGNPGEGMVVADPETGARLASLEKVVAEAKKRMAPLQAQIAAARNAWEQKLQMAETRAGAGPPGTAVGAAAEKSRKQAASLAALAAKPQKSRTARENKTLEDAFWEQTPDLFRHERDALAAAERDYKAFSQKLPRCLVSESALTPRVVRILPRGNWMDPSGEVVRAALPHYLSPAPPRSEGQEPLTRLDLARWLVSRENPLTARVVMNRLWKQFFGTGLSKVLDDLGAQGELPPNQDLLDWLACEFMDSGWDFRHMVRTVVNSRAYRRASTGTAQLLAADPFNRELARQSAFRLDAEWVRDSALAVSGLLTGGIGGASVRPYQPEGYWDNLNFPTRTYTPDQGPPQYRRGLYIWWQRTFLHPSLMAFDAPNREECCSERNRSNIPQQALVLLNDPTYVEAARAFAQRILNECKGSDAERIQWAFQRALQRDPDPEEARLLERIVRERMSGYASQPGEAGALLQIGQHPGPEHPGEKQQVAAWTHVARILLNLHETITRS